MKWPSGWKRYKERCSIGYQPWFAWYPVLVNSGDWIWFEIVERKPWGYTGLLMYWWEYRKLQEDK